MAENQRRGPARQRDIEDIDPQNDIRVRTTGTVISIDQDSITLDDGTKSIEVFLEESDLEYIDDGQTVRVLGRVLPTPDGYEIQGEIVQDFSDVDQELRDRVKKVVNTNE